MTAEEEPERSRTAGGCVLAALAGAPLAVAFAVSTEAGVLATVGAATGAVWWSVRRVPHAANPAPPPPPEGADDAKRLFSVVADESNPHRSRVVWHTKET